MNDLQRQFVRALRENQTHFGIRFTEENLDNLSVYYELIQKHNALLHLTAPATPETFAVRHVLESLFMCKFLPREARFADVGTGAGLPSIPCLILRRDLRAVLIESKLKKANFLREVLMECKLDARAEILNRQFEELPKPDVSWVCSRALDKFTEKLPRLLKWSAGCGLLFYGGNALQGELKKHGVMFEENLLPLSEQRFLLVATK